MGLKFQFNGEFVKEKVYLHFRKKSKLRFLSLGRQCDDLGLIYDEGCGSWGAVLNKYFDKKIYFIVNFVTELTKALNF